MGKQYLAHITTDGRTQTVLEHCGETAKLAGSFAHSFDAYEQGYLVGLAHDIGKYSAEFQKRLHGGPRVDHATAGAQECVKKRQMFCAFCVAGHHSGLLNQGSKVDSAEDATMYGRIKKRLADYSAFSQELQLPEAKIPDYCGKDNLANAFFIRMLYSALTDADYLDTESFMQGVPRMTAYATIEELRQKMKNYISGWFPGTTELNRCRCNILNACISAGKTLSDGVYTLTVPTGGGKTAASMAFALEHAGKTGKKRIIYVIPYTSIIEQTAQVYRKIFGAENVLEHHSNVQYEIEDYSTEAALKMSLATENWDAPIIVTTAVQFFESLYANRSSACRKLHNIAQSVIVMDEAQMLPVPYLQPCIYAITELAKHYHTTAVLCTATQPALEKIIGQYYSAPIVEICPKEYSSHPIFRRTKIQNLGLLPWDILYQRLNEAEQVLCIVNSRKNAEQIYNNLDSSGSFHLSTLMCPQHRKEVLKEIRQRLQNGLPCRVVSTSLIEAGVDVDFPLVYREEAGLDSIVQAAGRCNREGKRNLEESNVYMFQAESPAPVLFSIPIGAARATLRRSLEIDAPDTIHAYFQELLSLKGNDALDAKQILPRFAKGLYPFEDVAKDFRIIESNTKPILIPWEIGSSLIDRLYSGERTKSLFRAMQGYCVNIYEQHYKALLEAGDITLIAPNIAVLCNSEAYSEKTGLSLQSDTGKALFI